MLYVVGQNILFLVKQVRTKKKKLIYYRIYDISKLKKSENFSFITFENGKLLSTPPLALLILISAVNIRGAVALQAACEETT